MADSDMICLDCWATVSVDNSQASELGRLCLGCYYTNRWLQQGQNTKRKFPNENDLSQNAEKKKVCLPTVCESQKKDVCKTTRPEKRQRNEDVLTRKGARYF